MSDSIQAPPISMPRHPLRHYRERHNLRLQDLAGRAGMTPAGLSRIEGGITELPSCAALLLLARATDREVGEIDIFRWHFRAATGEHPVAGTIALTARGDAWEAGR